MNEAPSEAPATSTRITLDLKPATKKFLVELRDAINDLPVPKKGRGMFGRGTVKVADHVAMNAAGVEALNAAIGDAKIPQAVFETQDAAVEVLTNVLNGLEASVNRDDATQAIIAGWRWIRANTKGDGDKLFDKKKEACIADLREQAEKSAIIIAKPKLVQGIRDGRSGWSQGT